MTRLFAFVSILLLSVVSSTSAQEAPPPQPTHDKSTVLAEPSGLTFVLDAAGRILGDGGDGNKEGFYPVFGRIVSGAGWMSLGGGYRQRVLDGRAIVDGATAISWRAYKVAQTRFELTDLASSRISVGTQLTWQDLTQLNYFGPGAIRRRMSSSARTVSRM